jgi:hypothetical protein
MAPGSLVLFSILVIFLALAVGIIRNRAFSRKEKLHYRFAERHGLQIGYMNEENFTVYGKYRGYPVQIASVFLRSRHEKAGQTVVKCILPIVNPNRVALRAARRGPSAAALDEQAVIDRPQFVRHGIADWLEIQTNDMMFSSVILSEDVKITLYEVFSRLEAGLLCVYDEEMAFYLPLLLTSEEALETFSRALDLICDMKDELNR